MGGLFLMRLQGCPSITNASSRMKDVALFLAVLTSIWGKRKIMVDGNMDGVGFPILVDNIIRDWGVLYVWISTGWCIVENNLVEQGGIGWMQREHESSI